MRKKRKPNFLQFTGAIESRPDKIDMMLQNLPVPTPHRPLRRDPNRPRTPAKVHLSPAAIAQQQRARAMSQRHYCNRLAMSKKPIVSPPLFPNKSERTTWNSRTTTNTRLAPILEEEKAPARRKRVTFKPLPLIVKRVPVRKTRLVTNSPHVKNNECAAGSSPAKEEEPCRQFEKTTELEEYKEPPNIPSPPPTSIVHINFERPLSPGEKQRESEIIQQTPRRIGTPYNFKNFKRQIVVKRL